MARPGDVITSRERMADTKLQQAFLPLLQKEGCKDTSRGFTAVPGAVQLWGMMAMENHLKGGKVV